MASPLEAAEPYVVGPSEVQPLAAFEGHLQALPFISPTSHTSSTPTGPEDVPTPSDTLAPPPPATPPPNDAPTHPTIAPSTQSTARPSKPASTTSDSSDTDSSIELQDLKTPAGAGGGDHSKLKDLSGSEANIAKGLVREKWWQIWIPRKGPRPPYKNLDEVPVIPLAHVGVLSLLTYSWITPLMIVGYQRPLQATDLWKMDETREAGHLSDKFNKVYARRQLEASERNALLTSPLNPTRPSRQKRLTWVLKSVFIQKLPASCEAYLPPGEGAKGNTTWRQRKAVREQEWRAGSGRKRASIIWSLNEVHVGFWVGGLFKVLGDTAQLMSPLLTKALIKYSQEFYAAKQAGTERPNIGRGIGLAIGLFILTVMASVCQHQFFFRSMCIGVLSRATLISALYKRSIKLTVKARAKHPAGKIFSHVSADISRIDYAAQWFHAVWTAPIQVTLTMVLLILQIRASALVGMAFFVLLAPLQTWFMKQSFVVRQKSMKWTDGRSGLLSELLQGIGIIKQFAWESAFVKRLSFVRGKELEGVLQILIIRAANQAMAFSVPVLASVVSIVVWVSTGGSLDPAIIFTALSYFQLLRQPLMFLPRALSAVTDAQNALERLHPVFEAECTDFHQNIDPDLDVAVKVEKATFEWVVGAESINQSKKKKGDKKSPTTKERPASPATADSAAPFKITDLSMSIPRGSLVAIVGPVGSGKSSIIQALLGEMEQHSGSVTFGGTISYCSQQAWIQNLTLRENVLFGTEYEEQRYWNCIEASALLSDLELLPDADGTEIGEKGVNLSGGQKQRVNIARALYNPADIIILDDPLSALDAHVGGYVFDQAILGLKKAGKTVILVSNALYLLDKVDYVYTVRDGKIVEEGTYEDLTSREGPFQRLIEEFGGDKEVEHEEGDALEEDAIENSKQIKPSGPIQGKLTKKMMARATGTGKLEGRLMVSEIRKTGKVGWPVYGGYLKSGKAKFTGPLTVLFAVAMQGAQVTSTLWITWWQQNDLGFSNGAYEGGYAALGVAQAFFTFMFGAVLSVMCYFASSNLYTEALKALFYAPTSLFDTTPIGRVLGIFGKDVDTIDNQLADSLRMAVLVAASLIGSIAIICVFEHYFIVVMAVVAVGYWYFALFYRSSARECKRLDNMLRSLLYSHFSESLSGLATIRAYGAAARFERDNGLYMDLEDRAYILSVTNQRWLAIRLDFCGAIIIFAVALMIASGFSGNTSAQTGLVLTYLTSMVQMLGMVTRQTAEVENNMNSVERLLAFGPGNFPQEKPHFIAETEPPKSWPARGAVSFKDVVMTYRPGLPPVLKGISLDIQPGEKVGICGRTGAGKSSIAVTLFRMVEIASGSIHIDDIDISTIGLNTLRTRLSIIPQDPTLFSGTLRTNLDPFDEWDDARLLDAMRRSCLIGATQTDPEKAVVQRFTLDTAIEEGGGNLSIGERSLVSLARALVRDAQITLLDECSAALDLETDQRIQETIRKEFKGKTLLCIAHRLRTIIGWDRILVMSAGNVQEFATPLQLFDMEDGAFRGMCDTSNITRADILKAQEQFRVDEASVGKSV